MSSQPHTMVFMRLINRPTETFLHLICCVCFLFSAASVHGAGRLSRSQKQRVEECAAMLGELDPQDLESRLRRLEDGPYQEENIAILEAVARTYSEIVAEQKMEKQKTKEWLYSMVALNMGYLQLGGLNLNQRDTALNKLIRYKLKKYLPAEVLDNEDLFYSLDYLE
ncbi:MAG: hypothetical protein KAR05_03060 [Candidatus Omnitrophica bacterium]|nr:hypothetical protein [Candidatus Omnitrophota bacterium]